mgnify:CR=1 FL=1
MEESGEQYDLIYYDGLDTPYLSHFGSALLMDNYMHTEEAYRLVFEKRLAPEGVLLIELGGTSDQDLSSILAAMPRNVQTQAYWFVLKDSPMVGAPIFFLLATKSLDRLDRLDHLTWRWHYATLTS